MPRSRLLLATLTLAACSKSSPPPAAPIASTAPPTASCDDAAIGYARARADDHPNVDPPILRDRVAAVCQASAWSDHARTCFADASAPIEGQPAPEDCGARLTRVQRSQLETDLAALAPPLASVTAGLESLAELEQVETGLAECDAYLRSMVALARCDKFPVNSRDAVIEAGRSMRDAFGQLATADPTARQAAADACRQAGDALRQAGTSMGCPAP